MAIAGRELLRGGPVPRDVRVAAVVGGDRVPKDVVVGVDVLDLQADPLGGDPEVVGLLVVHLPGRLPVTTRTVPTGAGGGGSTTPSRARSAQPCPLRPALIPNLIRHGRHRSEHGSPVVCHDIVSGSATEVSVGLEFDEQAMDVPVGTDETLANLVSRKARKELLPILKQPMDDAGFLTSRALRSMGDTK